MASAEVTTLGHETAFANLTKNWVLVQVEHSAESFGCRSVDWRNLPDHLHTATS
jgi:hypothetical protein